MTGNLSDYTNRITSEHRNKPDFLATVIATVQPFVDAQACINQLPLVFDLDEAVGAQLDQVGQWLGFSRILKVPLTGVYFSWDTLGLGWEQGSWFGPFDPTTGLTSLSDPLYRAVLQLLAARCGYAGSRASLQAIVLDKFSELFNGLAINMVDNFDMTITYQLYGKRIFNGTLQGTDGLLPIIQQLFLQGILTIKPEGVGVVYNIWNGTAWVSSAFQYGIAVNVPTTHALGAGNVPISGSILPAADASSVRLQLSANASAPPIDMTTGSSGTNWYHPTTYGNTLGTFSISLPYPGGLTAGTYYVWAYDPIAQQTSVSSPITIS